MFGWDLDLSLFPVDPVDFEVVELAFSESGSAEDYDREFFVEVFGGVDEVLYFAPAWCVFSA